MKGDHLSTKKVLSIFDAFGDMNLLISTAIDHSIGAPDTIVEAGFLNLEPAWKVVSVLLLSVARPMRYDHVKQGEIITSHCPHHCL